MAEVKATTSSVNYISNVVNKKALREVQAHVLNTLAGNLSMSFGPMGSNTCIKLNNALNQYTKDGHTILKHIHFNGPIEESIREDIESITLHIVKTVGDGTTSAVILSKMIFDALNSDKFANVHPYQLISTFKEVVDDISDIIRKEGRECTLKDIYNICMVSTNGNLIVSDIIAGIYKEYGLEVFIDVLASTGTENVIKAYDGMTLNNGFADMAFVNGPSNVCTIDKPNIYFFQDPIDTVEMAVFLDAIISQNIIQPLNNGNSAGVVPTVIFAPKISRDLSTVLDHTVDYLKNIPAASRPPLAIVTDVYQQDEYEDIIKLCNGFGIKKYIDPELQKIDIEAGRAPTPTTVVQAQFCGVADRIVIDSMKTKIINPIDMHDDEGNFTETYNSLLRYLEDSLKKAHEDGLDANVIGRIKRRLNSLKSNLVEFHVGGITVADRDSVRDLVEDAVKNCRSAASTGVGYGANFEGLRCSDDYSRCLVEKRDNDPDYKTKITVANAIYSAYSSLVKTLYTISTNGDESLAEKMFLESVENNCPYNLRTMDPNGRNVLSSIESDITILGAISKIVTLMITCNQFIVPTPMNNTYMKMEEF